jgi:uncharacterized metal-binding protein
MKYTDNVRFSHKLNAVILVGAFAVLSSIQNNIYNNIFRSFIFVIIYAFASAFIQPDLDQTVSRPGRTTFPLGQLKNTSLGKHLSNFLYPINRVWYCFWHPYGALFTHRGLSHWPIIGTLTRAGYVLLIATGINLLIPSTHLRPVIEYLSLYFPTQANRTNFNLIFLFWATYILPIFISDFVHFLVDLFDSIRNNTKFESYAHEPGILKQVLNPKILKFHKKALKRAKSNAKKRKKS